MATNVFNALLSRAEAPFGTPPPGLSYVRNMDDRTSDKGCLRCLRSARTLALKGRPGMIAVEIPTNHCTQCLYDHDTCWNALKAAAGRAAQKAVCRCCFDPTIHKTEVVVSTRALVALMRANTVLLSSNDPKACGNAVFLIDSAMKEYTDATDDPWINLTAYTLHVRVAHVLATDPRNVEFAQRPPPDLSLQIHLHGTGTPHEHFPATGAARPPPPPLIELATRAAEEPVGLPEGVLIALSTGALSGDVEDFVLGTQIFGATAPPPTGEEMLDESTTLTKREAEEMHPRDLVDHLYNEVHKNILSAAIAYSPGMPVTLRNRAPVIQDAVTDGLLKPQATLLLPGDPKIPIFISAPNAENLEAALHRRHLGAKPPITKEAVSNVEACADLYYEHLQAKLGGDKGMRELAKQWLSDLKPVQPKAWTDARKDRAIVEAVAFQAVQLRWSKCGIIRSFTVKKNETLNKLKPRGIISAGDIGCVLHTVSASLLGYLDLCVPEFLERSVKHCAKPAFARRFAGLISKKLIDWLHSCDDFGAFDASLRQMLRDACENRILIKLQALVADMTGVVGEAAIKDRTCKKKKGKGYGMKVKTENMCRESGDKGTSDLNRVTNRVVTAAVLMKLLQDAEWSQTRINAEIRLFYAGASALADLLPEGDDGLRWYSKMLVKLVCACMSGCGTPSSYDPKYFMKKVVETYSWYGFNLEPQSVWGRDPDAGLIGAFERYEFVSLVCRPYYQTHKRGGVTTTHLCVRLVPKPRKTLDSLCATFIPCPRGTCPEDHAWRCLRDKALALMMNAVDCPMLYELMKAVHLKACVMAGGMVGTTSEDFLDRAGYNGLEMMTKFGEDTSEYFGAVERVRGALSTDRDGEENADHIFRTEMTGSSDTKAGLLSKAAYVYHGVLEGDEATRCREGAEAFKSLDLFVKCVTECSPDRLVAVWGAWRALL